MIPADALKGRIAHGLRVYRDPGRAHIAYDAKLSLGYRIGAACLHGKLRAAVYAVFTHCVGYKPLQLPGCEHGGRAAAEIERTDAQSMLPCHGSAKGYIPLERRKIRPHIGLFGAKLRSERAVQAPCPAKRNADINIRIPRPYGRQHGHLGVRNFGGKAQFFCGHIEFGEHQPFRAVPALGGCKLTPEPCRADTGERTPRKPCLRICLPEASEHGYLEAAFGISLLNKAVLAAVRRFIYIGKFRTVTEIACFGTEARSVV